MRLFNTRLTVLKNTKKGLPHFLLFFLVPTRDNLYSSFLWVKVYVYVFGYIGMGVGMVSHLATILSFSFHIMYQSIDIKMSCTLVYTSKMVKFLVFYFLIKTKCSWLFFHVYSFLTTNKTWQHFQCILSRYGGVIAGFFSRRQKLHWITQDNRLSKTLNQFTSCLNEFLMTISNWTN